MAETLATLRERIRVMVESAAGAPAVLTITGSTATLGTLRDRVEVVLRDAGNVTWSEAELDEAIRQALEQYSRVNPDHAITTYTVLVPTRELDLSTAGIDNLLRVERVWWAYDPATPGYPPKYVQFSVWPGGILFIDDVDEPQAGEQVRIWYTRPQTIDGLDLGADTSISEEDIGYLVAGAAGIAAQQRAIELAELATVDRDVVDRLNEWGANQVKNFRYGTSLDQPAWQRYGYAYDQGDIDEALRWALHRYSLVNPLEAITTLTFAADGYEVPTAPITNLIRILKVWCPYTAADPEDPPEWRTFDLWPGILHITDEEMDAGDIARIWYWCAQTIKDLDLAAATTPQTEHLTTICVGAAGYVAQMRAQESQQTGIATKLREWAEARLGEFEDALQELRNKPAGGFVAWAPVRRYRVPRY